VGLWTGGAFAERGKEMVLAKPVTVRMVGATILFLRAAVSDICRGR
jgi:hypothetical protein